MKPLSERIGDLGKEFERVDPMDEAAIEKLWHEWEFLNAELIDLLTEKIK